MDNFPDDDRRAHPILCSMNLSRDFARITGELKAGQPVEIKIPHRGSEPEHFVCGLITKSVSYMESPHLDTTLQLIFAELLANAEKAVVKRLYFEEQKVDPAQAGEEQLKKFGKHLTEKPAEVRKALDRVSEAALCRLHLKTEGLSLEVLNVGTPSPDEEKRARGNLRLAAGLSTLAEVDRAPLGSGEGRGRGLALCAMALKSAGIPATVLEMEAADGRTVFRVRVAPQLVTPDLRVRIQKELLAEVEGIPPFPEHIKRLMSLCDSPESDARQIAKEMEKDPAIVSELLRLANSGGFAGGRVAEVQEAITIIGLRNVSGLLLKIGAYQILADRYAISTEFLDHPIRVAFYARELAKKFKFGPVAEQVYAAGLLHDIGKIVLLSTMKHPEAFAHLAEERDRRTQINLEEIQCGVGHAAVGGLLAESWKFPENLRAAIEFHHAPHMAPTELRDQVSLVYLANMMADAQKGYVRYFAVEPDVLARFNLTTEDGFNMLAGALGAAYRGP